MTTRRRSVLVLTGPDVNVDKRRGRPAPPVRVRQLGVPLAPSARGETLHEGERVRLPRNEKRCDLRKGQIATGSRDGEFIVERHNGVGALRLDDATQLIGYASTTPRAQASRGRVPLPTSMRQRLTGVVAPPAPGRWRVRTMGTTYG